MQPICSCILDAWCFVPFKMGCATPPPLCQPRSQTLENTAIYTVFFNFSMCQCRWPTQTYRQKKHSKTFFPVFLHFSVKNAVMYTFFGIKPVQKTGFCSVFNALASKNSKYRYLQCFFICVRFSIAGSLPKWPKIPFQYPLKLRHPKIVENATSFLPPQLKLI